MNRRTFFKSLGGAVLFGAGAGVLNRVGHPPVDPAVGNRPPTKTPRATATVYSTATTTASATATVNWTPTASSTAIPTASATYVPTATVSSVFLPMAFFDYTDN